MRQYLISPRMEQWEETATQKTHLTQGHHLKLPVVIAVKHEVAFAPDRLGMRMSRNVAVEHGQLVQVALAGKEGGDVVPASGRAWRGALEGRAEGRVERRSDVGEVERIEGRPQVGLDDCSPATSIGSAARRGELSH